MIKQLIYLVIIFIGFISFKEQNRPKVILAILAHPDDETAIAPVLAKYAKENKVYLVIATDGRYGVRFDYKPGDSLAAIRQKETICAAKILGIEPPVFLGFHEDLGMFKSVAEYFKQSTQLTNAIKEQIEQINPDVIITFGVDGDTGHIMHRLVSNFTTEVILREGWYDKHPLYFLCWTQKDSDKYKMATGMSLKTVHPSYFNISISYSEEEEKKAMAILDCYKSQMSAEEVKLTKEIEANDKENKMHFRKFEINKEIKQGF